MPVPPESVQIGKCYLTARGIIRRVVACERGRVTFYAGRRTDAIGRAPGRQIMALATFAANAVREVPCPPDLDLLIGSKP